MKATVTILDNAKVIRDLGEVEVNNLSEYAKQLCHSLCKEYSQKRLNDEHVTVRTVCNGVTDVTWLADVCAG